MSNILITGASGGIGLAATRLFVSKGHNLFLTYNNNQKALLDSFKKYPFSIIVKDLSFLDSLVYSNVSEEEEAFSSHIYLYKVDCSDPKAVKKCVDTSIRAMGNIDLLVNNAGISMVGLDQDMSADDWDKILNTNLSSVTYFSRAVIPSMVSRHDGRIINISSMWGTYGASCEAAYSATKGGINAYTKALGKELAPSGIPVNAIAYGAIDTKMNGHLSPSEKEALCAEIPFGRMATPEEAAEMIYVLFSAPTYLTAQVIGFDGGF